MEVLSQLACALNRRDEVPNQELAEEQADEGDQKNYRKIVIQLVSQER